MRIIVRALFLSMLLVPSAQLAAEASLEALSLIFIGGIGTGIGIISTAVGGYLMYKTHQAHVEHMKAHGKISALQKGYLQNLHQEAFDKTLPERLAIGIGIDALVRNYLSTHSSTMRNITSFLIQAGAGYMLYDRRLAPNILGLYDKDNQIHWTQASCVKALLYALKVSTAYLSTQRINDGIAHAINKFRTQQKDHAKLHQEIVMASNN